MSKENEIEEKKVEIYYLEKKICDIESEIEELKEEIEAELAKEAGE